MHVKRLDHVVLTVRDIDAAARFYTRVLGMKAVTVRRWADGARVRAAEAQLAPARS